jgi:Transglutaminase-like superfamily
LSERLSLRWRLRVWRLLLTVPPLLFVVPVNRLIGRLESRRVTYDNAPTEALANAVDTWLRKLPWVWHWTCLKRATVLFTLLRRSGQPVQLHIGVKREPDKTFAAHAWLVRDGQPYLEPATSAFSTFQVITVFPEHS